MSKFDAMRASGDMMPTAMGTAAMDGKTSKLSFFSKKTQRIEADHESMPRIGTIMGSKYETCRGTQLSESCG